MLAILVCARVCMNVNVRVQAWRGREHERYNAMLGLQ